LFENQWVHPAIDEVNYSVAENADPGSDRGDSTLWLIALAAWD